ncbi:MAG: DUF2191 domain-containing protein [Thiothrix sp.]|nr:MAG: DUF2191 domain-containing protein [Thiothrix sp.]
MRTTLTIDDEFANNLMQITGEKTYAAAIRRALEDYIKQARKEKLLALRGKVQVEDNWQALRQLDTQS